MRAMYEALRARLETASMLTGRVHPSVRLTPAGEAVTENYLVLWPTAPQLTSDRFTFPQSITSRDRSFYDLRAVGVTADACSAFVEQVLVQLVGFVPGIAGRAAWPIRLDESGRVEYDPKTRLYYCDLSFQVDTRAA